MMGHGFEEFIVRQTFAREIRRPVLASGSMWPSSATEDPALMMKKPEGT